MTATITTHVLDLTDGKPARGLAVVLEQKDGHTWIERGRGMTDDDGRCRNLLDPKQMEEGTWRLVFETGVWFAGHALDTFYTSEIVLQFDVTEPAVHHHVPLLLSQHGYSTYRGS